MNAARYYSAAFGGVVVSASQDLFEIWSGSDSPTEILGVHIGQSSDAGDAEDEMLRIRFRRGNTTSGSGGTSITPRPLNPLMTVAYLGTVEANNTTKASLGTEHILLEDTFNVRAGYVWTPTPECSIIIGGSGQFGLAVELVTAPADALTMSGTIFFRCF